eukprot:scaffold41821_cov37-Phaeocystis_antarctica.AAC.1
MHVRWVDGVELSRKKGRLLSILATGSSHRPEWARCTPGGLMGVEPLIALPPRVLVAGRLQCGAARAGVRRGHGECVELAHLARESSKFTQPLFNLPESFERLLLEGAAKT